MIRQHYASAPRLLPTGFMPRASCVCVLFLLAYLISAASLADDQGVPNYAYSVFVGTGSYKIDDRTVYVLRAPLDFNLSEAEPEAGRRFGVRLLMPVAVGLTQYEDFVDIPELDIEDIQSISVVPGVEFPIWLTDEWTLSPFAQLGFGMDTKSDSRSIIWGSGARVRWEPRDAPQWLVGGEFLWAGNNPNNNQPTTDFTRWGVGAEYRIDTQQQLFDRELSWHLRALLWQYSDALRFEPPLQLFKLNSATEVGVSVGFSRPFNIFGYKFHQGGIGYEWADGFKAVKFYTTFPF